MSGGGKFKYGKVLEVINAEEKEIEGLGNFLQRVGGWEQTSVTKIGEMGKLLENRNKLSNKELVRALGDISINRF